MIELQSGRLKSQSLVCCVFHGGAVAVMAAEGAGGLKVLLMHAPFALAFGYHTYAQRTVLTVVHAP